MKKPKEPGHYYFDGKAFSQPKLLWRSENVQRIFEVAYELLDARHPFRMVVDPNAEEGLSIRPDGEIKAAAKFGIGIVTTNFMETCPPLPPEECDID